LIHRTDFCRKIICYKVSFCKNLERQSYENQSPSPTYDARYFIAISAQCVSFLNVSILHGNVPTNLRCGKNFYVCFVGKLFLFLIVKEFRRSVEICQSYCKNSTPPFLKHTVFFTSHPTTSNASNHLKCAVLMRYTDRNNSND